MGKSKVRTSSKKKLHPVMDEKLFSLMHSTTCDFEDGKQREAQEGDGRSLFDNLLDDISKEYCDQIERTVNDCFSRLSKLYCNNLTTDSISKRSVAIQCGERFQKLHDIRLHEREKNHTANKVVESNIEIEPSQIDNLFDSIADYFKHPNNRKDSNCLEESQASTRNDVENDSSLDTHMTPKIHSVNSSLGDDYIIEPKRKRLDSKLENETKQEAVFGEVVLQNPNDITNDDDSVNNTEGARLSPVLVDLTREDDEPRLKNSHYQTIEMLYADPPFQFHTQNEMFKECKINLILNESYSVEQPQPLICFSPSKCLPDITHKEVSQYLPPLPDGPDLSVERRGDLVVLIWSVKNIRVCTKIRCYYIYAYQENNENKLDCDLKWKKVGKVDAIPCPVAVTLSQFSPGKKYHFAVLATDIHDRNGPFSKTVSITL